MKRIVVLMVILAIGLIIPACNLKYILKGETQVPAIEKWPLFKQWEWRIGDSQTGIFFDIGTHKLYKAPDKKNAFGTTMSFRGSDEIILKAWWTSKSENYKDTKKVFFAVKTETGKWVFYEGSPQGLAFEPEIQEGKMVSLKIFLSENKNKAIRVIKFQSPLSPLPKIKY